MKFNYLLDFLRNYICLLKLPFLASLMASFSTICVHMLSKFAIKSAQKTSIFLGKVNYAKSLLLLLFTFTHSLFGAPTGTWFAYVLNETSNSITPIQLASGNIVVQASIFLPFSSSPSITPKPSDMAISPDGNSGFLLLFDIINDTGIMLIIDILTNTIGNAIPLETDTIPTSIAITPNGQMAYVTNLINSSVTSINLITQETETEITLSGMFMPLPLDIAIHPNGQIAYITDINNGVVIPLDIANQHAQCPSIPVGQDPIAIAITPDGNKAYVANFEGTVSVIDLLQNTVIQTMTITTENLMDIAINPEGTKCYVLSCNPDTSIGTVTVIDIANNQILATVEDILNNPSTIVIAPDGLTAYVTDPGAVFFDGNTVTPIDLINNVTHDLIIIQDGLGSANIAITPDQAPVASFTATRVTLDNPTIFDASSSSSPVGKIALYTWDFGDGMTTTTTNPIIDHTYAAIGSYSVSLTVVNSAGTSITQKFTGHTVSNNGGPTAQQTQTVVVVPIPILPPPIHLRGIQKVNTFATQKDYVNILTWKAPVQKSLVAYRIYRDADLTKLAATIPADKHLQFKDHHRKKNHTYTYYIVSVDQFGNQSVPATVVVNPRESN
jgi:DNA-binding beta-propeller fold protein YncE